MWKPSRTEIIYLLLIFGLAYIIRGIPSWFNWGWGNDFGIYYGLSQSLVEDPQLFKPYSGWGQTYHYFPMLYILIAGLHKLTGITTDVLLRVVSPIIGSLSVVFFYYVVKRLNAGKYIPLFAGLLLALNPFHAYQTAHAAPLTLGHFFLVLSLVFFLHKDDRPWATHALYISSILLIMSHHLTSFIYLLIIIGISFFRGFNSKKQPESFRTDLIYIILFSLMMFAYWALIATPVFYSFMSGGLYLSPYIIVAIFYLAIAVMVALLQFKYRMKYEYTPRLFSKRTEVILVFLVFIALSGIVVLFSFSDLGTGFSFLPSAWILLVPTIIIFSIALVALNRIDFERFGAEVKGIFYPIFGIFIFSLFTWNSVLLPFRFFEYLAYPFCILSALGIFGLLDLQKKQEKTIKWRSLSTRIKGVITAFIIVMVISGATTYAVQKATSRFEESIPPQVYDSIVWLEENAPRNMTIASDHRISNVLWQRGFNTTYDYAYNLWFSNKWNDSECLAELEGHGIGLEYGTVGHLVIDSVMVRDGVQSNINETPRVINGTSYEKFNHEPYELVFEATSQETYQSGFLGLEDNIANPDVYPYSGKLSKPLPNALHWCRVYIVNWTYINVNIS
jgi:hypothetical protein